MNKGYFLEDGLIIILITSLLSLLCFSIYKSDDKFHNGYLDYSKRHNLKMKEIYLNIKECECLYAQ